jgi:hypothetical protein
MFNEKSEVNELMGEWVKGTEDITSVSLDGKEILLKNVPVEINKKRKTTRVLIDDILKAEQEFNAQNNNLQSIEIPEILLMFAETPNFIKGGYIDQTFRFNKMVFYFQKEMEKNDLGSSYVFDEIVSCRAGPVPRNLKNSIRDLESKGLIKAIWSNKPGVKSEFKLTNDGMKVAKRLWNETPDEIKKIILKVKQDIFFIDATQLKEKVHREYPEYKKIYVDLDEE